MAKPFIWLKHRPKKSYFLLDMTGSTFNREADVCYVLPLTMGTVFPMGFSYRGVMGFFLSLYKPVLENVRLRSYENFGKPPLP